MNSPSSVVAADVARFAAVADEWWDPNGKFAPLHRLNPARLAFIREAGLTHFPIDGRRRAPFAGLRLIDVGCGGGLICEPMRRLGFEVVGVDAAGESLAVAGAHAEGLGLSIDYRAAAIEDLVAANEPSFDVVLALEVIEHVANPGAFLANCARLMTPGGIMILGTLNRTLRSLALAKLAAEYVLRWVPAGAHDWRKFLTPEEVSRHLESAGLTASAPSGLVLDPWSGQWRRSGDTAINYMITAAGQAGS